MLVKGEDMSLIENTRRCIERTKQATIEQAAQVSDVDESTPQIKSIEREQVPNNSLLTQEISIIEKEEDIDFICADDLKEFFTFEEFVENIKAQTLLKINLKSEGKERAYTNWEYLTRIGIILAKNGSRIKIIPIIGANCWTLENWKRWGSTILSLPEELKELTKALKRLNENNLHYDSCTMLSVSTSLENKPVCNFKEDCIFNDCGYATSVFLNKMEREYDKLTDYKKFLDRVFKEEKED